MEFVNKLLKAPLAFGRPLQLEEHVFDGEVVLDRAAIVIFVGFGASISVELDQVGFVNLHADENAPMPLGILVRSRAANRENEAENRRQGECGEGADLGSSNYVFPPPRGKSSRICGTGNAEAVSPQRELQNAVYRTVL